MVAGNVAVGNTVAIVPLIRKFFSYFLLFVIDVTILVTKTSIEGREKTMREKPGETLNKNQ